jgi:GT2 family glycosyltransferase
MSVQNKNFLVRLTVLMSVHNGAEYLTEALDSILRQTCPEFELIVVDDGSTDGSADLVAARFDPRVRLLRQPSRKGLAAALNLGLAHAEGEYVARMDADDISLPQRLEKQLAFMDANPDIGICGTWMEAFSEGSATPWRVPVKHNEIHCRLLFESVLYHPTVMLRKALLDKHGLRYDTHYLQCQDYEFWNRCARLFKVANLGEVLLRYRIHSESIGSRRRQEKLATASRVRKRLLAELGLSPSAEEMVIHDALAIWVTPANREFLKRTHAWLLRLQAANREQAIYPEPAFSAMLAERWYHACEQASPLGMTALRAWADSPFRRLFAVPWVRRMRFWTRCMVRN